MNFVILTGNVQPKDPEIKEISNGNKVGKFTLATKESYKDKNGQWQDITDWHNIVVWGKLADKVNKISRGDIVSLTGKVKTRKWQDKSGQNRYTTEIVTDSLTVEKRSAKQGTQPADNTDDFAGDPF